MPSSLIFVGLVVLWLLILVPTVARRQQEVARLSPALLSGRVLERPMRHRYPEVDLMERTAPSTVGELVEARGVPGPRSRDDDRYDEYDSYDAEIDDDGRVHGLDDDLGDGRERDPRSAPRNGEDADDAEADSAAPADHAPERDDRPEDVRAADRDDDEFDPRDDAADTDEFDEQDLDDRDLDAEDPDEDEIVDHDDAEIDDRDADGADLGEEIPQARYRPGRGGYDPEAAAEAAHAKYAFRQRVVLALLVLVVAAGAAALLVSTVFWWAAGAFGLGLVGYLTYLRRQVRIEEAIRARRTARLVRRPAPVEEPAATDRETPEAEQPRPVTDENDHNAAEDDDWTADDGEPTRVRGTGEPLGVLPAHRRTVDGPVSTEHESSLPRLEMAPPPPVPVGTSLVDVEAEEEPYVLADETPHRRAVGE